MEFSFKAEVVLILKHVEGAKTSKHVATEIVLLPGKNLDSSKYLDKDNLPNKEGSKVFSNVLVQGLVGNIHMAHEYGFCDSAEHLRWIIAELEKGFVTVANVTKTPK